MCGRYEIHTPVEELARRFDAAPTAEAAGLPLRYNVAPSLKVPVVRFRERHRELAALSWGLLPSWSKDGRGHRPINARAEDIFAKPMFRNAVTRRRCLVPTDGFYEWQRRPDGKQPWHVGMLDGSTFALGGIWEYWARPGEHPVLSCAVIVTDANELVAKIHDRMPVIIAPQDYDRWLDPELTDPDQIRGMMTPYPAEEMHAYPVSREVNNANNEGPQLIQPVEPQ